MGNQGEILNDHEDQNQPLLLTIKSAASELACSEAHVRRLIASGDLPAFRLGQGSRSPYRVPRLALESYVAQRLDEGAQRASHGPQLKTRRCSGSSAAWAFTFSTALLTGGFHG